MDNISWNPDKKLFGFLKNIEKSEFNRCLEPLMACKDTAIRAHSIQNSKILDKLVRNGHVVTLIKTVSLDNPPTIGFNLIGRNKATTFTGLCSIHDQQIFALIEKYDINIENREHLFLLALRAAYRELHTIMESATRVQATYEERVKRGIDPQAPCPVGMFAVERMFASWLTFRHKSSLDSAYQQKNFAFLEHDVLVLKVACPTIAVCSLFAIDSAKENEDALYVHLNVFPVDDKTSIAVLSYLSTDAKYARNLLAPILKVADYKQRHELSKIILANCENFVISPDYYDSWNPIKKDTVRKFFIETLFKHTSQYDSPNLDLFD